MSAPNIATLFDFETPYEDTVAAFFANLNVGGLHFLQTLTPRTNLTNANNAITPRLEVKMSITGLGQSGAGWQETPVTVGNVSSNYYSYYQATLTLGVCTQRSNALQPHGLLRGATRQGMLELTAIMNTSTIPYFQTVFVTPQSSQQGIDSENDEIQTQLLYMIEFAIPASSFPNTQID